MIELMTEMLGYLGGAFFIGIVFGYLVWGWGQRRKLEAARIEGRASARTSMDGDAGLSDKLAALMRERDELSSMVQRLEAKVATLQSEGGGRRRPRQLRPTPSADVAPEAAGSNVTPLRLEPHMQSGGSDAVQNDRTRSATPPPPSQIGDKVADASNAHVEAIKQDAADAKEQPEPKNDAAETVFTTATAPAETADAKGADDDPGNDLPVATETTSSKRDAVEDLQATLNELAAARLGLDKADEGDPAESSGDAEKQPAFQPWSVQSSAAAAPPEFDDLTRIEGVGAMVQSILNENGVYRFDQIAGFTPEDFVWLETVTDMAPGQIDQRQWIEQAQSLQSEKLDEKKAN